MDHLITHEYLRGVSVLEQGKDPEPMLQPIAGNLGQSPMGAIDHLVDNPSVPIIVLSLVSFSVGSGR